MFQFLNELSSRALTSGVYYTLKRLNHPKRIADAATGVTAGDRKVASRVIDEINAVEGTSWKPGDREVVDKYILELSEIVMAKSRNEPGFDPERGQRNLAILRERYENGKVPR